MNCLEPELTCYKQAQQRYLKTLDPWKDSITAKHAAIKALKNYKSSVREIGGVPRIDNTCEDIQLRSNHKRNSVLAVLEIFKDFYDLTIPAWEIAKKIRWRALTELKAAEFNLNNKRNQIT